MKKPVTFVLALVALLAIAPVIAQDTVLDRNPTDCVTDYNPDVDYFPDKVTFTEAQNVQVEYFNHYKVVTVIGSSQSYDYVLVQCGTPAPEPDLFPEGTQFVEVPAGDIISLSTTFLPGIAQLGLAGRVVGLDSLLYTSTPEIRERIDEGEIIEVAPNFELNLELVLDAEPDLVMSDDFDPGRLAQLIDAGIFTAVNTDYLEVTPLGRAEWFKYIALFYNAEAEAEALFEDIVREYEAARELAATVPATERPVVLWNVFSSFSEVWSIPGEDTYAGTLIQDAGGLIALGDEAESGSALLSFEAVYEGALDADIWVINLFNARTVDDLLAQDERYADFAAVQTGNVWNNDLDVNENGGNNYFELGVTNPHLVLQDLVAMFHPEMLPEHEFHFYQPLEGAPE